MNADFQFADAQRLLPHLHRIGVTHLYLSPIFQARPGSTHGYDVLDPGVISDALGGAAGFHALARAARALDIGIVLDIVPNHMAASPDNPWWCDVLQRGSASRFARFFDLDWGGGQQPKIPLPVLGGSAEELVASGELRIAERAGVPVIAYHDRWFPLPHDADPSTGIDALLEQLPYELKDWRTVHDDVGYRRFFDITDLIGVRVEDMQVFAHVHALPLELLRRGDIQGLRIDHVDGLFDPRAYLERLRAEADEAAGDRTYIVVEKILADEESLPSSWPVDGTTGYEFARMVGGLLLNESGYESLRAAFAGNMPQRDFEEAALAGKQRALDMLFKAEATALARQAAALLPDIDDAPLHEALRALTTAMAVYRTYIDATGVADSDRERIAAAVTAARARLPNRAHRALDQLHRLFLLDVPDAQRTAATQLVMRWQQLSGPVMAKGFEDTALYAWPLLLAANEVGGEPQQAAVRPDAMHAFLAERAQHWPLALSATSTHDTKRSEDTRARLLVLADRPADWIEFVSAWKDSVRTLASSSDVSLPDRLSLLQALIGVWPMDGSPVDAAFAERIGGYALKAAREAKQDTNWLEPNAAYERALASFVKALLLAPEGASARSSMGAFARSIQLHGASNSLAMLVLRCMAPGVPDTYRGTESWSFDLVDPDNRRPLPYDELSQASQDLQPMISDPSAERLQALLGNWRDGRVKLYTLTALQKFRVRATTLFGIGSYLPLTIDGPRAEHAFAFMRTDEESAAIVVVSRCPGRLIAPDALPIGAVWAGTRIRLPDSASHTWRGVFDGGRFATSHGWLRLDELLATFPHAVLEAGPQPRTAM